MKITTSDKDGNVVRSIEIDDIESIPAEAREKVILELIGCNLEQYKAKLAYEEKHQEEITTRTKDIRNAIVSIAEFAVNEYLPAKTVENQDE